MLLTKITKEEALNSNHREYNASEWAKMVNLYASYKNCQFYENREITEYGKTPILAIYEAEGIRFMKKVKYTSSLTSSGLTECKTHIAGENEIEVVRITPDGYSVKKDNETREILKRICEFQKFTVFTNEI